MKRVLFVLCTLLLGVVSGKSIESASAQTQGPYKVGSYYNVNGKEGVVFEVSADGYHGKIVSMDQTNAAWDSRVVYCDTYKEFVADTGTLTGANSYSDGKSNTDKIMRRSDRQYFEAAKWCRAKGASWYLPAVDELKAIKNVSSKLNATLKYRGGTVFVSDIFDSYWSSTEYDEFCAWDVHMGNGYTYNSNKNYYGYVRAVSAF